MSASASLEVQPLSGVAVVTLRNPPVNALAVALLRDLEACLKKAHADRSVRAIVIKGDKARAHARARADMCAIGAIGADVPPFPRAPRRASFPAASTSRRSPPPSEIRSRRPPMPCPLTAPQVKLT